MAKNQSYSGTIDLISGLRAKNNGDYPLMDAHDVQTREDGTRLDSELEQLWSAIGDILAKLESGVVTPPSEDLTVAGIDEMTVSEIENKNVSEVEA